MTEDRVIGKGQKLPWHLSEDLKRFRRLTTGHPVVMGRPTFESIGRLLPGRQNVILTRHPDYQMSGAMVFGSIEQALSQFEGQTDELFIIGGAEVYRQTLDHADRIYLTLIHQPFEGDVYFPPLALDAFVELSRETWDTPFRHSYVVLERVAAAASK